MADYLDMANVLISETHQEIRHMLERMMSRMGHEAHCTEHITSEDLLHADVLIIEPTSAPARMLMSLLPRVNPMLPVICASVQEPPQIAGVMFVACLQKPFTQEEMRNALQVALLEPEDLCA